MKIKVLLITFLVFGLSLAHFSQTNGCGSPTVLPVNTTCITQAFAVNQNNSNQEIDASCATAGTSYSDAWYTVTGTGNPMTITITGTNRAFVLAAFTSCAAGELACDIQTAGTTGSITFPTTNGTTYYIQIQRRSGNTTQNLSGDICAVSAAASGGGNDDCSGANSLTVNPDALCGTVTSGTVLGATASPQSATDCFGTEDDDVWFSFVATGTTHYVSLLNTAGSTTDMYHSVWEGTCPGLTLVAGTCSDGDAQTLTGLVAGNTYFVRVYTWTGTTGQTSTFDVCIGTPGPPPANDDCSGATSLTVNTDNLCGVTTAGSVASATASSQGLGGCFGTADDDVWYSFVATSATHSVSLLNTAGSTTDMYHSVWEGTCPGSMTLVAGTCSDGDAQDLGGLTIGNTYFIRVYTYTSTTGQTSTFDVCVGTPPPPPPNGTCAGMTPICSDSPFVFTATSGGADADVVEPGNNYDCLFSSPNPTWFFMEILTSGVIAIDITAGSDIDFALWGPYTNLTAANADCGSLPLPIDCSYSSTSTEQANTASAIAGEVYIVLVTNYANVAQTITLNSAGSNTAATDCTILPIELVSFSGTSNSSYNTLNWNTETEINNDYFILERSDDGVKFEEVVKIDGAGNSNTQLSYTYLHESPINVEYYRLKQVDFNGEYVYSKLIAVKASNNREINIYPNPVKENFSFELGKSNDEVYTIRYTNLLGSISSEKINITESTNQYQVSQFENLNSGIYFVHILNEAGEVIKAEKIVKK